MWTTEDLISDTQSIIRKGPRPHGLRILSIFIGALGLLLFMANPALSAPQQLEFKDSAWEFSSDDIQVEKLYDQTALRMRSGVAARPDIKFQDGTIEFDMAVTPQRAFTYVRFRIQGRGEHEEVYFRPHKSGLPDAVQYTPVYNGSSNWQLYHGPGNTAAAEMPPHKWIHIKIMLQGSMAAIFVGDVEEPQLIVPQLARTPAAGSIALRGFLPRGAEAPQPTANFANLVIHPGEVAYDFSKVKTKAPEIPGLITQWHVSPSFVPPEGDIQELPEEVLASPDWQTLQATADGLIVLGKYLKRPDGSRRGATLARVYLQADKAQTYRLNLGYSDQVSVFLNRRLLFSGDDSYSRNFPRRQGLIGLDQGSLYLALEPGSHELILAVSDGFGGWGLMGQIEGNIKVSPLSP